MGLYNQTPQNTLRPTYVPTWTIYYKVAVIGLGLLTYVCLGLWAWQQFLTIATATEPLSFKSQVYRLDPQVQVSITAEYPSTLNWATNQRQPLFMHISQSGGAPQSITLILQPSRPGVIFVSADGTQMRGSILITTTPGITTTAVAYIQQTGFDHYLDEAADMTITILSNSGLHGGDALRFPVPLEGKVHYVAFQYLANGAALMKRVGDQLFPWTIAGLAALTAAALGDWWLRQREFEKMLPKLREHADADNWDAFDKEWEQYRLRAEAGLPTSNRNIEYLKAECDHVRIWKYCARNEWRPALDLLKVSLKLGRDKKRDQPMLNWRREMTQALQSLTATDLREQIRGARKLKTLALVRAPENFGQSTEDEENSFGHAVLVMYDKGGPLQQQAETWLKGPKYFAAVVENLSTGNGESRAKILLAQVSSDPAVLAQFSSKIAAPSVPLMHRVKLIGILGEFKDAREEIMSRARAILLEALDNPVAEIRLEATDAIAKLVQEPEDSFVNKLRTLSANDQDPRVRRYADLTLSGWQTAGTEREPQDAIGQWLKSLPLPPLNKIANPFAVSRAEEEEGLRKGVQFVEFKRELQRLKERGSQILLAKRGGGKTTLLRLLAQDPPPGVFIIEWHDWSRLNPGSRKLTLHDYADAMLYAGTCALFNCLKHQSTELHFALQSGRRPTSILAQKMVWYLRRYLGDGLSMRLDQHLLDQNVSQSLDFLVEKQAANRLDEVTRWMNPDQQNAVELALNLWQTPAASDFGPSPSYSERMAGFLEIVRKLKRNASYEEVWVLVDNLDAAGVGPESSAIGGVLGPLLSARDLVRQPGWSFKFFAPAEAKQAIIPYCNYTADGLESIEITWTPELLGQALDLRVNGLLDIDLPQLMEPGSADKIKSELIQAAQESPGQLFRLAHLLLRTTAEQWERTPAQKLVTYQHWLDVKQSDLKLST